MIPTRFSVQITCDSCGGSRSFILDSEDIDSKGMTLCLDDALREEAWESLKDYTFCPECVSKVLSEALTELVRKMEVKT